MTIRRDAGKWLQKEGEDGTRPADRDNRLLWTGPAVRDKGCRGDPSEFRQRSDGPPSLAADRDLRRDGDTLGEITSFFKSHGVRSVALSDRIIGCPHEEGIDYPVGEPCPPCLYWAKRDRWTGELGT